MPLLGGPPRKVIESVHVFAALSPDDQRILLHRFKDGGGIDVISVNAFDAAMNDCSLPASCFRLPGHAMVTRRQQTTLFQNGAKSGWHFLVAE
jgi:hypothetical protein